MSEPAALVWFKRDLRTRDHASLASARTFPRALALLVIEPEWLQSPECDAQHVGFWLDCAASLQCQLAALGMSLVMRVGSMPQVLTAIRQKFAFTHLLSHEETGSGWTYQRDK
jgi:deoxyribodipyrimidine photo-lyase